MPSGNIYINGINVHIGHIVQLLNGLPDGLCSPVNVNDHSFSHPIVGRNAHTEYLQAFWPGFAKHAADLRRSYI
jgi:hypothetical protein